MKLKNKNFLPLFDFVRHIGGGKSVAQQTAHDQPKSVYGTYLKFILVVFFSLALSVGYAKDKKQNDGKNNAEKDIIECTVFHKVKGATTITEIAKKYAVEEDALKNNNKEKINNGLVSDGKIIKITYPNIGKSKIYVGDTLKLTSLSKDDKCESTDASVLKTNNETHAFIAKSEGKTSIKITYKNNKERNINITVLGESNFLWILLVVGVIGLALCVLVRVKFWKKIKSNKKSIILLCAIVTFIVVGMMAWATIRHFMIWAIVISVALAVIVIVVRFVVLKKKSEQGKSQSDSLETKKDGKIDYKQKYENAERELSLLKQKVSQLRNTIDNMKKEREELLSENISLGERIDALRHGNNGNEGIQTVGKNDNHKPEEKTDGSSATFYAESIVDGYMYKVKETPNEDTVFEMHLRGSSYATFEVYKQAEGRVVANPSYLDGCDKQLLGRSRVTTVRQGEARLDDNGRWKVSAKLSVHIE